MMIDTSFCIDLLREQKRGEIGPATRKLINLGTTRLQMSLFVYCELQHGVRFSQASGSEQRRIEMFSESVSVAIPDRSFATCYGTSAAKLQKEGLPIPQMDLLIGVHAASLGFPVLTRDHEHFKRIDGLVVESY